MELTQKRSFFERPLAELVNLDLEKAIYIAIFLLAVVSRFWDLGTRGMSHDESLHALYSYYLYNGSGYEHNPMMHGPFLFHASALIYFLFGDTDYTARIVPAIFGVFMVMSPLLFRRWLGRLGAVVASILLLISPSILYYSRYIRNDIYITVWTMLLIAALFHFIRTRKPGWFYLGATALMLSLATKENAYIFGFIGLLFIVAAVLWERLRRRDHLWLYIGFGLSGSLLLSIGLLLGRLPAQVTEAAEGSPGVLKLIVALVTVVGGSLLITLLSATLLRSRHPERSSIEEALRTLTRRHWLLAIVIMLIIYVLLFTTFFTNPAGVGSGLFGSINYWLAQQEVQRGGQPWYYYLLLLPMYEFVPLLFGTVASVYYLIRGVRPHALPAAEEDDQAPVQAEPSDKAISDARFVAFLIFWNLSTLFIYSWAGEKMPWLVVHPALPMIILTGKFAGDIFSRVDWQAVWRRGGALLALLLPVTLFGLYMLIKQQPFQGLSVFDLRETGNWVTALLVTLFLIALTVLVIRRLGGRYSLRVAIGTLLVVLSFFTVRFAWMATYINYDYATELLFYAHGGPDLVPTMNEIAEISERTVGDKMIKLAYDNDVNWPLEWYLREYPNRVSYGDKPDRDKLNSPIVIAGAKIDAQVQPYLGDRYYRFKRRLVWWPNQQYMGLTFERIRNILTTPEKREILWNILYFREYPKKTDDWYHVHNFYLYVRKDVAQQLWDFGAAPPEALELPPDPYIEARVDVGVVGTWGEIGTVAGQVNHPRGIAVGPDGNIYVVDSDNHRVQVFDPDGIFLREWGGQCNLSTEQVCADLDGDGPMGPGDGQFQEPWGIAVAEDGRVYVADTWNHRVQVFDSDGSFLTKWGMYGMVPDADSWGFYGPRDIAVDDQGRVFVTDTGNKRVMVYDQDGNYLDQWGSDGVMPGYFSEPVGIDLDAEGNIYVADTWNQRIQVFDSDFAYLREWTVNAWPGTNVVNKPYLAVDAEGRVYVTDPEGYLVIVFNSDGELLATFGRYGFDEGSFSLPTGIDVDAEGYIYVTDTNGNRIEMLEPLP